MEVTRNNTVGTVLLSNYIIFKESKMSAKDLIKQYNDAVEAEERARAQKLAEEIQAALETFLEFCRIWLGDLWDEFRPGEVKFSEKTGYGRSGVLFRLPVSFMGIRGDIEADYLFGAQNQSPWNGTKIDFGYLHADTAGPLGVKLDLRVDNNNKAREIEPRDMGHLLAKIERCVPILLEKERQELEKARADALEFYGQNLTWIVDQVNIRVEKFPDLEHQIRAAGAKAIEEIAAAVREREEQNMLFQAMQEERDRLGRMADYAWESPFTVYQIKFGVHIGDGEGGAEVYAESIYTLEEDPDSDGYYRAFDQGKLSRKIRPEHRLSTEVITIRNCKDAPYELKRFIELTSKRIPEVTAMVYLPPVQFFTFDMEEVEGAMEAE